MGLYKNLFCNIQLHQAMTRKYLLLLISMLMPGMLIVFTWVTMTYWEVPMQKLLKKLEDIMVAITFAEAGEYDKANKELGTDLTHEQEAEEAARTQALQKAVSKPTYEGPGK